MLLDFYVVVRWTGERERLFLWWESRTGGLVPPQRNHLMDSSSIELLDCVFVLSTQVCSREQILELFYCGFVEKTVYKELF